MSGWARCRYNAYVSIEGARKPRVIIKKKIPIELLRTLMSNWGRARSLGENLRGGPGYALAAAYQLAKRS
jgi:hypothetical protein